MTSLLWIRAAAASVVLACRDRHLPVASTAAPPPKMGPPEVASAPRADEPPITPLFDPAPSADEAGTDDGGAQRPPEGGDFAFD